MDTRSPRVSVILPVRNGGVHFETALRSMLAQTFADFELLVMDDGSTDGTLDVARAVGDDRVRIVSDGQPRGLAHRLNEGIAMSRGRYIARMDADDASFARRLEKQTAFLDAEPSIDLLGCRAIAFRGAGEAIGLLPFAATHEALCARPWSNIPLPHPGWMGRRQWFEANPYRFPEVMRAEDQELLLRAGAHSRYACLEEVLLGYRQGDYSLRRTLVARRSLLASQVGIFINRGQLSNLLLAVGVSAVKVALDVALALPGAGSLWFRRMAAPAPACVQAELLATLGLSGQSDAKAQPPA